MAINAGTVYSELVLDSSKYDSAIDKAAKKMSNLQKKMEEMGKKISDSGKKFSDMGGKLTTFVSVPLAGIGVAATKMAMDAVESENLFEVSMGSMANSARAWSEEVSKALGLNAYEVRENVGTFNVMLTSMGETKEQALSMSEGLTQLAYDMASFYNLKPEEAFEKLKAGISGETEPLKSLGILINDTAVETYALTNGIIKQVPALDKHGKVVKDSSGKIKMQKTEMTDAQKVAARYGLIMQATAKAQGDLGRTMDSPTNKLRTMTERIKQAGIEFGQKLIPLVDKAMDMAKPFIDRLNNMSDAEQEHLIKIAAIVAAAGPAMTIIGKATTGIGGIISMAGKFNAAMTAVTTATKATTAATAATTAATGGFKAGLAGLSGLIGPGGWVIAGLTGITIAGIALYNHFKKESIPQVQLFGKETSKTTEQAVGAFLDLNDKATKALEQLNWSGQKVTKDMANSISSTFDDMGKQIIAGLEKHNSESYSKMQTFLSQSNALTKDEETKILAEMVKGNNQKQQTVEGYQAKIKEILQTAANEHRALTKKEQQDINKTQQDMVNVGIQALSQYEIESKAIMDRMRVQNTVISARQAADVVKNSNDQKNKAIMAAEEQCNAVVQEIVRQRDEAHSITSSQADKLIADAIRQKDKTVEQAQQMHNRVVSQAKAQAREHVNEVNWETGQVKTKWQRLLDWLDTHTATLKVRQILTGNFSSGNSYGVGGGSFGGFAEGTDDAPGGWSWVGEEGPELVYLPQHSKVIPNDDSESITKNAQEQPQPNVTGNLTVNINIDGKQAAQAVIPYLDLLMEKKRIATNRALGVI